MYFSWHEQKDTKTELPLDRLKKKKKQLTWVTLRVLDWELCKPMLFSEMANDTSHLNVFFNTYSLQLTSKRF